MFRNNSKTWRSGTVILWNWKIRIFRPPVPQVFASASGGSFRTQRSERWLVNRSSKRPKLVAGTFQYVISMETVPFIDSISGNVS